MEFGLSRKLRLPRILPLLLLTCGGLGAHLALAQSSPIRQQAAANSFTQEVRFIDSATGYAVCPEAFTVRDLTAQRVVYERGIAREAGAEDPDWKKGVARLALPKGSYQYLVRAAGYRGTSAAVIVDESAAPAIDFFLDPLETPPEIRPERLKALHSPDSTLVVGFVVDDDSGQPLEGVRIARMGAAAGAITNARGFFQLHIALPPLYTGIPTADLLFEKTGYQSEVRRYVELTPNSDWIYRIRLAAGQGQRTFDERNFRRRGQEDPFEKIEPTVETSPADVCKQEAAQAAPIWPQQRAVVNVPATLRVGRNCSCTTCSGVEVYSLETYAKHVLPAEWFNCWGNLAGGMESLKAGGAAVRSYGSYYTRNPLATNYDICDNTCCQVFGAGQATNTNTAIEQTPGSVLVDFGGEIARTEYSAENNNKGCGDCSTGTCLFDPVCCGAPANGHGRGMCQYGSVRWATGTYVTSGSPCSLGSPQSYGAKDWQQILQHYYPGHSVVQGQPLAIADRVQATAGTDVRSNPSTSASVICRATSGNTGQIVGGPQQADGFTWWQVRWDPGTGNCPDGTIGWSADNALLRLTPGVEVALNASAIYVTATAGQTNLTDRGVSIREANRRAEAWTASTDVTWATLAASSGQTPALIRIVVNIAGLAAGTYAGKLTVASPGGAFSPVTATLTLMINPTPIGNVERSVAVSQNRVDGYDLARMARAFGSRPGHPNWDASVNLVDQDLNSNGVIDPSEVVIDAADISELVKNFGKTG